MTDRNQELVTPEGLEKLQQEKAKAKRPRNSKPFVIMVTGNQGGRHKMYAESLGVSEYLNKPFKMDKLIATAEKVLGAAAAAQQPKA